MHVWGREGEEEEEYYECMTVSECMSMCVSETESKEQCNIINSTYMYVAHMLNICMHIFCVYSALQSLVSFRVSITPLLFITPLKELKLYSLELQLLSIINCLLTKSSDIIKAP